jgi:hypothetical protein
VLGTGLLLALDQQLDRDRRRRGHLAGDRVSGQRGADAEGMEQHLPLVVGSAPGQQKAVAFGG